MRQARLFTLLAVPLLACSAHAQTATLPADSLVCQNVRPAAFIAKQDSSSTQSASETLRSMKSNLEKMRVLQQDPTKDASFKAINQQVMALLQGVVDDCVASEAALDVKVIEVLMNQVAKVSMSYRGQLADKFVLERALSKPR